MITFNTPYRNTDETYYASTKLWLGALYANQIAHKNQNYSIESLETLQTLINHQFKNIELLVTALTHKSFYHENKTSIKSDNEKLEFLGDSIVNLIVTKFLFKTYPHLNEGELSKLRGSLVNEEAFAKLARSLFLQGNILIGKGEFKNNGVDKDSLLADAFEAIFGALSIELEINSLERIFFKIIHHYESSTNESYIKLNAIEEYDSKSKLQEVVMDKLSIAPIYKAQEIENGFEVELFINEKSFGKMQGISKKKLEKDLAKYVLENNLL